MLNVELRARDDLPEDAPKVMLLLRRPNHQNPYAASLSHQDLQIVHVKLRFMGDVLIAIGPDATRT